MPVPMIVTINVRAGLVFPAILGAALIDGRHAAARVGPAAPGSTATRSQSADLHPLSAGSVALLVEHATESDAQRQLGEALLDSRANVRAVAARVVFVTGSRGQLPALTSALSQEDDERAGSEEVRALLGLGGSDADAAVRPHLARLGKRAAFVRAEVFARTRPAEFVAGLPDLGSAVPVPASVVLLAMKQHPERSVEIARAILDRRDSDAWVLVLDRAPTDRYTIPDELVIRALASAEKAIQEPTVWYLVRRVLHGEPVSEPVLESAAIATRTPAPDGNSSTTWESFGREILARSHGRVPSDIDWASLIRGELPDRKGAWDLFSDSPLLTASELKAVRAVTGRKRLEEPGRQNPMPKNGSSPQTHEVLRSVPVFAPGLLQDLLRVLECHATAPDMFGIASIHYREDGRPARISPADMRIPAGCQTAVRVLAMLTIADAGDEVATDFEDIVLVLFNSAWIACADEAPPVIDDRVIRLSGAGGRRDLKPPKRTKEVKPIYPQSAQQSRVTGDVVMEAIISSTGCLQSLRRTKAADLRLDVAAMTAASQWRFEPMLLDGAATPVIASVSVNFTLR